MDDDRANLTRLAAALASLDCALVRASSGAEALRRLVSRDFAVIVIDIHLPGLDGFQTASLIRESERSHSTPIIFLTADDRVGASVPEGYRLGAVDYMYRPFEPEIVRAKVAIFIDLFRKALALQQVTADLLVREQQVAVLNAALEGCIIAQARALATAQRELQEEADERVRTQEALRAVEHAARAEAEVTAARASVLAEVSRVLVEDFIDHRPMLARVAHIASVATATACVIQLMSEEGQGPVLLPVAIEHADQTLRVELARVLSAHRPLAAPPWPDLDGVFLEHYPLRDSISAPMLARTSTIGALSLGRFGADAPPFTDGDREFSADLTARVALAVENARLFEKARQAIEQRDDFLTIAAHELKTPLTSIQGYSQLLSHQLNHDAGDVAARARRSAHMIEDRSRHLARLVEQILDVSRLVASRMRLNHQNTDLVKMIRELVAGFKSRDTLHELRLYVRHDHLLAAVDPMRLQQVMSNLIDNALRYSPDSGAIDIVVELEQNDSIVLSVRDRGLGIPEEHRAHIFDRFHQAHAVDYRSGMGLGLHISREIVLLHGGEITASFPEDGGSKFTVRLPRSIEKASGPEAG